MAARANATPWTARACADGTPAEAAAQARDAETEGLHEQVDADVAEMLLGKGGASFSLEAEVAATLADPDSAETEYWQAVLRRIA